MSEAGNKRKAKNKEYYKRCAKQARKSVNELGPGQKGFLCTSNKQRKRWCQRSLQCKQNKITLLNGLSLKYILRF